MQVHSLEAKMLRCAQRTHIPVKLGFSIPEGCIGIFSDSMVAIRKNVVTRIPILRAGDYGEKILVPVQSCTVTPTRIPSDFLLGYVYIIKESTPSYKEKENCE